MNDGPEPLTREDRAAANARLLAQLDEAKRAASRRSGRRVDLLGDAQVSALVNQLLLDNRAWLIACVKAEKRRLSLRESVEELASTAVAGKGGADRAGGMLGAILSYDYRGRGPGAFAAYVKAAIHNALVPTPKERRALARFTSLEQARETGEAPNWVDRSQRQPRELAISAELTAVLEDAIERLPGDRQWTAKFILEHVRDTGERPAFEQIARAHHPPVSTQRAGQLVHDVFVKLKAEIEQTCPDLAKDGIGGWAEFNAVFGKGHRLKAEVSP